MTSVDSCSTCDVMDILKLLHQLAAWLCLTDSKGLCHNEKCLQMVFEDNDEGDVHAGKVFFKAFAADIKMVDPLC